ncbi:MAG: terpene cyclase/mutase family protein [Clostridiales bacterium]|nr:terpene cyclase/mutase family protein [Clostridiales bacterium]
MRITITAFLCAVLAAGAFLPTPAFAAAASYPMRQSEAALPTSQELGKQMNDLAAYELKTVPSPAPGQVQGDWTVFALARAGKITAVAKKNYLKNLEAALPDYFDKGGKPIADRFTDYARISLALVSVSVSPRAFHGADFLAPLEKPADNLKQGANGPAYALLALDSAGFKTADPSTRETYIGWLLAHQTDGGGWNLIGSAGQPANPDVTAFALQALAPYALQASEKNSTGNSASDNNSNGVTIPPETVAAATNRALAWLSSKQSADGGFGTLESSAQVLVALNAYGIAANDPRFVKDGHSAYDALMRYYLPAVGAFRVSLSEQFANSPDPISTDQGFYALNALYRSVAGQSALYRITTEAELNDSGNLSTSDLIRDGIFGAAALVLLAVSRRLLPKKEKDSLPREDDSLFEEEDDSDN